MSTTPTAKEQIEELERQISQLRHRAVIELKVKLGEARHTVALLEKQLSEATGTPSAVADEKPRRTRVSVSIEQIVAAIRGGASNYRAVAKELGCSPITVAKKVESEGKSAGIKSSGSKATFKLSVK